MRNIVAIILMIGLVLVGWNYSMKVPRQQKSELKKAVELAKEYEVKGYYKDAIIEYQKALEIKDCKEWKRCIVIDYLAMGDMKSFKNEAVNYLKIYDDEEIYIGLINYYFELNDKESVSKYLDEAEKKYKGNEEIKALRNRLNGEYVLAYTDYIEVGEYMDGYAVAKIGAKNSSVSGCDEKESACSIILNQKGKSVIDVQFDELYDVRRGRENSEGIIETTTLDESLESQVFATGDIFGEESPRALDENGYIRAVPFDDCCYKGVAHDERILVEKDGKWGYEYNASKENGNTQGCIYDDATVFDNGVAAVKMNGKWALIDKDENNITDYIFDDIYIDELKDCSRGRAVFVKQGGSEEYSLISLSGEVLSQDKYHEVKGFLGKSGVAAVKKDGEWGAIDNEGNVVLDYQYDELGSSTTDYIPFMNNNLWGYMDTNGNVMIEAKFDEARAINDNGYGFVNENGSWETITIYSLKGEDSLFD